MVWRKGAIVAGAVLLTVIGSFALAAMRDAAPPAQAPSSDVEASPLGGSAERVAMPPLDEGFLGVILSRESVDITARHSGRLSAVHVRLGDVVPAGGRIASLDLPGARSDLSIAEAALRSAEIEVARAVVGVAQAEERLTRRQALSTDGLTTAEELALARYQRDAAKLQVDAARAQVGERRARVAQIRQVLEETEIRAPFTGTVAARYVDPGASVTPETPIVRFIDAGGLFVRFAVPEGTAAAVRAGLHVHVRASGGTVPAIVDKIAPEVDAASRMVVIEATLGDAGALRSGEMARVAIAEGAR